MSTPAALYRKYKQLSDDIFSPIPEYTGQGDNIRELVQTRRKALRCADLREKYTECFVPEDKRDENHEIVIHHLRSKALECKSILDAIKPPVQVVDPRGFFPYIDLHQPQLVDKDCSRRQKSIQRKDEQPQRNQQTTDECDILSSINVNGSDRILNQVDFMIREAQKYFETTASRRYQLCSQVVENTCKQNKFNFSKNVKSQIAFSSVYISMGCQKCSDCSRKRFIVYMDCLRDPKFVLEAGLKIMRMGFTREWLMFAHEGSQKLKELEELQELHMALHGCKRFDFV